jgi:Flp pilus assembly pilin Flp
MEKLSRFYVKTREVVRRVAKGQTMTEYALILAAIAIVVYLAYKLMGNDINSLVSTINGYLTGS